MLNTHRPLFQDVRLRRAVNYAIDRRALARLGSPLIGLPEQPTHQYLPPPTRLARKDGPFDLAFQGGWIADFPDPDDFLNYLLGSGGGGFIPAFDDPAYSRKAAAVAKLSGPRRYLAYGALDADVARNDAPWVPYANLASHDFFSARMGCQIYQPVYGMDLAALCVRKQS